MAIEENIGCSYLAAYTVLDNRIMRLGNKETLLG
jgi:hypothetical protein